MSDHPPIPPNCPYFEKGYFAFDSQNICSQDRCFIKMDEINLHPEWRPIISAVARCAWLDEYQKVDKKYRERIPLEPTEEQGILIAEAGMVFSNADAWAEWGKQ